MTYGVIVRSPIVCTSVINPVLGAKALLTFPPAKILYDVTKPKKADHGSEPTATVVHFTHSGTRVKAFVEDYYFRMHIDPGTIDVGNLLSSQTRSVLVWNANFSTVTLTGITPIGTTGMTLVEPHATPYTFAPMEAATYSLQISTIGPPVISGSYSFHFSSGDLGLDVAGKRVVVWPFVPQHGFTESLEWKTDLLKAKAGEQRTALRVAPRQTFQYNYFLDERQYAKSRMLAYGWGQRIFGVPVWSESTLLGAVSAGTSVLTFDTTHMDFRDGDVLLLWQSDEVYEAIEIAAITATEIDLRLPTTLTFGGAYVMPLRYGRSTDGLDLKRDANRLIKSTCNFQVTANAYLGASISLPTYKSLDVMNDRMAKIGDFSEKVIREVNVIDNGISVPVADSIYTTPKQGFTLSWEANSRAALWRLRQWIHSRKGKQKSFWLPTWNRDFELMVPTTISSVGIEVRATGYALYYGVRDIMIHTKAGATYYNRITGSSLALSGNENFTLESAVGAALDPSDIDCISLMHKVRFDADRIEISHSDNRTATITVPAVEVIQ